MFSHLCVVYFLMMLFAVTGSTLPASAPSPVQGAQLLLVAVKLLSSSYKGYRSLIPNLFCERRTPTDQTQILITIAPKLIANMWIYFLFSNYLSYCTILPTRNHWCGCLHWSWSAILWRPYVTTNNVRLGFKAGLHREIPISQQWFCPLRLMCMCCLNNNILHIKW